MTPIRSAFTFTPIEKAYDSPRRSAPIGFTSRIDRMRRMMVITKQIFTSLNFAPEKLPFDQSRRFTIFESDANVTIRSVIAVVIYPIMTPAIRSVSMFLTFRAIKISTKVVSIAPMNELSTSRIDDENPILAAKNTRYSATKVFAPDEMPSTNGPAKGFSK